MVLPSSQVLLLFTFFFLLLAVLSNWVRHTVIVSTLKRVKAIFTRCVLGVWKGRGREGEKGGVGRKEEKRREEKGEGKRKERAEGKGGQWKERR